MKRKYRHRGRRNRNRRHRARRREARRVLGPVRRALERYGRAQKWRLWRSSLTGARADLIILDDVLGVRAPQPLPVHPGFLSCFVE
jgi:hypothetical protein